ncbi:MAG: class I SAM-dependent methyltransferase [bacterium]
MKISKLLYSSRFFPNIYVTGSPFKIYEYHSLLRFTRFSGNELILDLGCGSGLQTCLLAKKSSKVFGLDVGDLTKAEAKAHRLENKLNIQFINTRLQDAPFSNGMFDKIFSFCVIEHIPEYLEILQLCHSLLKKGGELIISVDSLAGIPADLKNRHARQHAVSHYFRYEELKDLLTELTFREVRIKPMFCSKLAHTWFRKGILKGFSYGIKKAIMMWLAMSIFEFFCCKRKEGIFLTAHCRK